MTERTTCAYCGKRYRRGGATRDVVGGRSACGWCVRWTASDDGPLTEARVLDAAVCRLVGRRTTIRGAAALVDIQPYYAVEGPEPSSRRWPHIDRDKLRADFDRCYPPSRYSGKVIRTEVQVPGKSDRINGYRQPLYALQPPEFVPGPPVALEPSPRRPLTEAEKRRAAIQTKRNLAAGQERRRQGRIKKIRTEVAKQAAAIARLEAR